MNTPNDPKGAAGALKTPLGLIPSYAMEQTAWVHKLGSDKYGPFNWRKTGVCASTYVNAILRHLNAWRDGETVDSESGISHLAHVACSCNILLDAGFCGTLQDDRNITPPNTPARKMDKPTPIPYTEYRLLEVGEPIQDGDQFYSVALDYWLFTNIGNTLTNTTGATKYRRKVEPVKTEYRILEVGEIVQEGDDYFDDYHKAWMPSCYRGLVMKDSTTRNRRKVEPVEEPVPMDTEYRLLEAGEIVQEGDEFFCPLANEWECTSNAGQVNKWGEPYRRKVEASNEPDLCTCGRIKINHFMLGLICEDCEIRWQDPY